MRAAFDHSGRGLSESEPLAFPLDRNLADRERCGTGIEYGWLGTLLRQHLRGLRSDGRRDVGRQMPQAFAAKNPKGISLDNPQNYRFHEFGRQTANESEAKISDMTRSLS